MPVPPAMNLLLLSNSRRPDGRYLVHALDAIAALAAGRRRALFLPFAGVTVDWDDYTAAAVARLGRASAAVVAGCSAARGPRR